MVRRYKMRGIKANKIYRIEELADTVCVTPPTVRNWLRDGMQQIDANRPTMIMGSQALAYLSARKAASKQPMAAGEFYCLRCKAPRVPFGAMADYLPTTATSGRLKALCGVCNCPCNRNVRACDLTAISKVLVIEHRGSIGP